MHLGLSHLGTDPCKQEGLIYGNKDGLVHYRLGSPLRDSIIAVRRVLYATSIDASGIDATRPFPPCHCFSSALDRRRPDGGRIIDTRSLRTTGTAGSLVVRIVTALRTLPYGIMITLASVVSTDFQCWMNLWSPAASM